MNKKTSLPTHAEKTNVDFPIKERDHLYESRLESIEYVLRKLNLNVLDTLAND